MGPVNAAPGPADVAVVGAGIIGVACALQLARHGQRVVVFDPLPPGHGASFGNAGHLATEQVFPIADASILRRLPAMLLNPAGPLRLDWQYLPQVLPWFVRLLLNLRPAPFARTVAGLRQLNESSVPAWHRLLGAVNGRHWLQEHGSLLVYERRENHGALQALQRRLEQQQVPVQHWAAQQVQHAAPQLSERLQGGLFFPATGHFPDPYQLVVRLAEAAKAHGVQFVRSRVEHGHTCTAGVQLATEHGPAHARRVLIACGAHSAALTASLAGKRPPLDTERGYHLMLPRELGRLPFAVTSLERKFILTPMDGGLRLAGTVEFAGLAAPARMQRAWQLQHLADGLFRQRLDAGDATPWMGLRPSLPDSLPVIDRLCDGRVLLAFGHQHLGLTHAAVTAEMVTALALGTPVGPPLPAVAPYRLARFSPVQ